jgi:hypothetical protein
VLKAATNIELSCGAIFDGHTVALNVPHLRYYSERTRAILQLFMP